MGRRDKGMKKLMKHHHTKSMQWTHEDGLAYERTEAKDTKKIAKKRKKSKKGPRMELSPLHGKEVPVSWYQAPPGMHDVLDRLKAVYEIWFHPELPRAHLRQWWCNMDMSRKLRRGKWYWQESVTEAKIINQSN